MKKLSILCFALLLCLLPLSLQAATVTDAYGQPLTLDAAPQRIAVLPVWAEEMLLDMLDSSRIAGVSAWGDNAVLSATAEKAAAVEARVSTGDVEGLIALAPDLVIIDTFSDFDGSLTKTLQDAGIPVLALNSPTNFDDVASALTTLGEITQATEEAAALRTEMEKTLAQIDALVSAVPEDARVTAMFYEDYYDPSGASAGMLCAYGAGSTFQALCDAAGVTNVCDAPLYSAVSKEKVVAEWQPQLLIVPGIVYDETFSPIDDGGESIKTGILADETLQSVPAVQAGNILALPECYRGSTSHYMAQGALALAQAAYPDLFN
jgi:ABC-type Fe3+-hydroxamate transport system substrate-binding protein